ncbi:uncharacterized protein [Diadema antillarum]|uniref:uncharacterized protein n=1 Tax=Diadema antillarum TaxID=105358 RepID=UPI003A87866F
MGFISHTVYLFAAVVILSSLMAQHTASGAADDYYGRLRSQRLSNSNPATTEQPADSTSEEQCVSCCRGPGMGMGMPGPPGPPGVAGAPGIPGVPGNHGISGHDGNPGVHGPKGDMGSQGLPGLKGSSGTPGRPGVPGLQGRVGPRGPPGSGNQEQEVMKSAFSAARLTTLTAPAESDIIVTFEHVFTNYGNHFDAYTGVYTVPAAGAYFFIFNIHMASTHKNPYVKLMLNGKMQVSVHDYDNRDAFDSTSNSVILEVETGDQIWLQLDADNEVSSNSNRYTTFSGYLLFKV